MRVLAVDLGTSSVRTALFDDAGRATRRASEKYAVTYGPDGSAELSPDVLLRAVRHCCSRSSLKNIDAIAGSAFWHALLGLDGRQRPITPIYTWADSRADDDARAMREEFDERQIHARTGCMLRTTFWPAKLRWLQRTQPRLFGRVKKWVSPGDWIFTRLFESTGTSESMASATGLYDFATRSWAADLCVACQVDPDSLGEISSVGQMTALSGGSGTLRRGTTTVFAPIGDGAASNLGSGSDRKGVVAINIGTSAAVRMVSDVQPPFGLFRYAIDAQRSVVGGAVSNAGNLHAWCRRELRMAEDDVERALRQRRDCASNPLVVLPFWVQERAPDWPEQSGGVIRGLTQSSTAADIVRASAAAVFYRLADILDLLETATGRARKIIVSGGILRSKASLQLLADSLGRDIDLAAEPEASLRGAALYGLSSRGINARAKAGRTRVRHERKLAAKHRDRRERQHALEQLLVNARD